MSIPFNDNLQWSVYTSNPDWHSGQVESTAPARQEIVRRVATEVLASFKQIFVRGIQFIRDGARLVLKVPIRLIRTAIKQPKDDDWKQRERALINAKLTGYAFVQLISVPAKFLVALTALATSAISLKRAQWLLDKSEGWTAHLDGRASQLEALKEEGTVNAPGRREYDLYRTWLYGIDPKLCRGS